MWRSVGTAAAAVSLAACSAGDRGSDAAELANIAPWNVVPKSTPSQLVSAFRRFCVEGPRDLAALDGALRNASYVPTSTDDRRHARVYLVDDRRPAIVLSRTMCIARARSRTGQTEQTRDFIAATFPQARPMNPAPLGRGIEQAWAVNAPGPAIIATERRNNIDTSTGYALILYRPSRNQPE